MGKDDSRRPPARVSAIDAGWDDAPTDVEAPEGIAEDLSTVPNAFEPPAPAAAGTPKPSSAKRSAPATSSSGTRNAVAAGSSASREPTPTPGDSKRVARVAVTPSATARSVTPTGMRAAPRPSERKPHVEPSSAPQVTVAPVVEVGSASRAGEAPERTETDGVVPVVEPAPAQESASAPQPTPQAALAQPARHPAAPQNAASQPAVHEMREPERGNVPGLSSPVPIVPVPRSVDISYKADAGAGGAIARMIGAFLAGAVLVGAGAFWVGRMTAPKATSKPGAVASQSATMSGATPAASGSSSPLDRTAGGDPEAIQAMQARPPTERVAEETLAIASGRARQRHEELSELGAKRSSQSGQLADGASVQMLLKYAKEPETTVEAQRIMATLPAPQAADLIYEVWVGTPARNPTTELAEELVYSKEVRAKASPALGVALDLRAARTCEEFAAILPRATEAGDRRSQALLGRLAVRVGCGPTGREDCFACLHPRKTLELAIRAVRVRASPRF